ncbi:uncharacterized protein LOC119180142 isoform X12 [Rhipicephalus microplus]|uniref:uncharacterized protein LOC119180142 isoform X12 n=1 Tax=Rhipicephalus microplus TaxID=6941 RepID=UPI003F6AC7CE
MSLCFLHALFTFILMLALSGSKEMVLEPSLCPVNSSTIHNCVNTTWNSLQCQDESFDEMTGPSYPVPIKYWDESADKDWCEGTVSDVSSDMELHAADRIDRVKETTTVFYLGEE